LNGEEIKIVKDDIEIISSEISGWMVESNGGVTVAIDTELDGELINEGLAREFVNRIQNMRKDAGFEITDRIKINFKASKELSLAINNFKKYIANETLADLISENGNVPGGATQDWKIGDFDCSIQIVKTNS